ncbi:MAG: hypothetical protein P8N02_10890 [Actinomycetota bacterium]|nr:hypothetical protein [Actinomycetota bacterium]
MERSSTAPSNGARRTQSTPSRGSRGRAIAGSAIVAATLFFGGVASAQTTVDPEAGGSSDQGTSDVGSQTNTPIPSSSGGTTDGGNLALTGGDVTGIALIGAAAAGAGGLLVLGSRRRRTDPVTA